MSASTTPSKRQVVSSTGAPAALPHNSQAILSHGPLIFVSGQMGVDVKTNQFVEGPIAGRVRATLSNLEAILKSGGSDLSKLTKVNIYLTDMNDYVDVNEAYKAMIPEPRPARTCVCVKALPKGTDVEIECVALQRIPSML